MITCDELYNLIKNLYSENEYIIKYEELVSIYPDDRDKIDLVFYDLYKFEYSTTEEREKRLDTEYRNIIRDKYKTCMITGKPLCVSQVAHIYPHTLCKLDEKYDPENGFLLSAELHILFDSKDCDLKINPDTQNIIFSKKILEDNSMNHYKQYNNKKIELSDKQKYYLHKKYN